MINTLRHLLPNARAWRLTTQKTLSRFLAGLSGSLEDAKSEIDLVFNDINPLKTRKLDKWENHFSLRDTGLSDEGRRNRLLGEWRAFGGQDPKYIQDTLQAAGFDLYVHEWWEPNTNPPVARNPFTHLWDGVALPQIIMGAGHDNAYCGGSLAFSSSQTSPAGYPLVNKVLESTQSPIGCGHNSFVCGGAQAYCSSEITAYGQKKYAMPTGEENHPYFFYIGGRVFPSHQTIPASRKEELEDLCLKISPTEQWLGMLITYT